MELGSNVGLYIVLGLIVAYLLAISGALGEISAFLNQVANTMFYGAEFLTFFFIVIIVLILYYQFEKDRKKVSAEKTEEKKE